MHQRRLNCSNTRKSISKDRTTASARMGQQPQQGWDNNLSKDGTTATARMGQQPQQGWNSSLNKDETTAVFAKI